MPTKRTNSDFEGHFKSFMNYIYFNYSSKTVTASLMKLLFLETLIVVIIAENTKFRNVSRNLSEMYLNVNLVIYSL